MELKKLIINAMKILNFSKKMKNKELIVNKLQRIK